MRMPRLRRGFAPETERAIDAARQLIQPARHIVALTGAGISTPSGIPDFRSSSSGLWVMEDPMEVASIWAFRRRPEAFFEWVRPLADSILAATPNPAHVALAHAERVGKLKAVVTQNIDDLHRRAGSRHVLELHGHLREATCIKCFRIVPGEDALERFMQTGTPPRCVCGGILKPNVILFGEMLPQDILTQSQTVARASDLMIVVGSSLEVAPASDLPLLAVENGARLIVINYDPTPLDDEADVVIRDDVARVLPTLFK